ncbi:hypothetical protein Hypma_002717 [Hypsizygus marmoreus]|uniref:Uncharacterized protein n=1 Tax=Hypsizygus marmoreus TaxID=39966 RepID=A0A369J2Z0_HYPMA|nr:hypothetical protein Hypma_002717 [Hypsizygus marmoreus]
MKTSESAQVATATHQEAAQSAVTAEKLTKKVLGEVEVLANIGQQDLDGSKAAANRVKIMRMGSEDIHRTYQQGINNEIKSGTIVKVSRCLQTTLRHNVEQTAPS